MIRKRLLHPLSWFCTLCIVGGVVDLVDGPVVEGDPVLGGAPGGEVGVDDEEPGDHHQLEEEGQEREEEAGDRLANRARSLDRRKFCIWLKNIFWGIAKFTPSNVGVGDTALFKKINILFE